MEEHKNIESIFQHIWKSICNGKKNRHSEFHTFSLATCHQNVVKNRTVVLRGYDEERGDRIEVINMQFAAIDVPLQLEETTFMGIPCMTLRDNTERPETIEIGTNELLRVRKSQITSPVPIGLLNLAIFTKNLSIF